MGFSDSGGDLHFYFYNANTFTKIANRYDVNSIECFSYREGTNIEEEDNYEFNISIITNENNVLFFEEIYIEDGNTYRDTYRFTSNSAGDQITLMWDEDPDDIEVFTRTNTTHSSLCN